MHDLHHLNRKRLTPGFTLVELLVVMAVIAIFIGILGVALIGGDRSQAVQAGQRTVGSLVAGARSHAILNQTTTRLIFHFDPPANAGEVEKRRKFLRFAGVVVLRTGVNPDGSTYPFWEPVNDGSFLPRGVFFVPPWDYNVPAGAGAGPDTTLLGNVIPMMTHADTYWERRARSVVNFDIMRYNHGHRYDLNPNPATEDYYFYIQFSGRGMTDTATEINSQFWERRIVVAPAVASAHLPRFEEEGHPDARGGMLRQNGSFVPVNVPASFPIP